MKQFEKLYLYQRVVRAKIFIEANYNSAINLNAISHHAQFSKFHFIRLFKKVYGTTPSQYLLKVRLDRAQALLANGYSVFETSALIGFESPTSFAGSFKKQTQYTPSAFQKKQIQRADDIIKHPLKFVPNCFAETHGFKK